MPMKKTMEAKQSMLFFSYARVDAEFALKLAKSLRSSGVHLWIDQLDIQAGDHWDRAVEQALTRAESLLLILSPAAVDSKNVMDEVSFALDENKRVVPVLYQPCKIPFRLRRVQHVDFTADFDRGLERLLSGLAIKKSTEEPQPSVQPGKGKPVREEKVLEPAPAKPARIIEPGTVFQDPLRDGSKGPEMVIVPAGSFEMGDLWGDGYDSEKPAHRVRIPRPFALGKYPVTFEEYGKFAKDMGRDLLGDEGWGRGRRPVINVPWEDAGAFAEWLSRETGQRYRLPSEAEWEYAARSGGKKEKWAGTSTEGELDDFAWYSENSKEKTHPVGEKKPNGLGLHDMSGNVYEWMQDCWHESYNKAPGDGSSWLEKDGGDCGLRVIRGGSWGSPPVLVRTFHRFNFITDFRNYFFGFRLAQDIE